MAQVWANCMDVIREHVTEQSFKTWFEPIIPYKLIDKRLIIQVPSQFFYEWLENNYVRVLRKALDYSIGKDGQLEYTIIIDSRQKNNDNQINHVPTQPISKQTEQTLKTVSSPFQIQRPQTIQFESQLKKSYTFDNFVEGSCNRLAKAASKAVADKPSVTAFNPLMIYGDVGLGKTHLVQAIGNYIEDNSNGEKLVLYCSSEKFTSQFINSIRENNLQDFMNFYMTVDVLIIDDIQFLAGKEKTQETFFHIFNHLHQMGKQIVLTSDRPPKELSGMEDRLLSRFKWGLTTDIQIPDFETRVAIIQNKLESEKSEMDWDVVEYLANAVDSNVRELEGVLTSLIVDSALLKRKIDIDLAKHRIKSLIEDSQKSVNIDKIIDVVTVHYNVKVGDVKGKSRLRDVVIPRQVAMYLAKEMTELSLKTIGYHFGGRDHSTVIHAIQTINDLKEQDKELDLKINNIRTDLRK